MIPQKKTTQLIDRMNKLLRSKLNEFEIAHVRSEISKIDKNPSLYTDSQELKGMLSAILGDVASLKKHYEAAIKHSGSDPEIVFSYAVSLTNVFDYKSAVEICDKVIDTYPDDISMLNIFHSIYSAAYSFEKTRIIENRLSKLDALKTNKSVLERIELNNAVETVLSNNNVNWVDICDRSFMVIEAIRKLGHRVYPLSVNVDDDFITIEFPLDIDIEDLLKVDSAITECISNSPLSRVDKCVSYTCTSQEDEALIAA